MNKIDEFLFLLKCEENSSYFWQNIDALQKQLEHSRKLKTIQEECSLQKRQRSEEESDTRKSILRLIEDIVLDLIQKLCQGEMPSLRIINGTKWDNVRLDEETGLTLKPLNEVKYSKIKFNKTSIKMFTIHMKILSEIYLLITRNSYSTKRDLYYDNVRLYEKQNVVDRVIDNISRTFMVPRHELHLLATSKGLVAGDLSFYDSFGEYVNCQTSKGVQVPAFMELKNIQSDAKFVLVIEKEATFSKLLDSNFIQNMEPCIILTAKGIPDVNSRHLLHILTSHLEIPALGLADADPYGIDILCIYKYGSVTMSFDSYNLTAPDLKWTGILPTDISLLRIKQEQTILLTQSDKAKLDSLIARPYFRKNASWMKQVEWMMTQGIKTEIQALASLHPTFLTDVYLPNKIKHGGWL